MVDVDLSAPASTATDGEELSLHPLGPEDDVFIASTQWMDCLLARLPEGCACP